ncbi:hypothetical protein AU468_14420 [Alkalispirochaeta sphaeroplastigenens]|uniref:NIF system FeS cluster assembly NifU N-terminal domain-containing protein n=1 Tax=Alkalispirochaeta sphaeroplastigenens TaxID=1187066 RepID=A0A2S4JF06_9SPIO|nr:iron-sulfur cluster assembly scaffold protein [Alkalispirochaeta sphaeroplastigenens]POQ98147.1 hypothetical protein AU468_14420 [Alkalispirochaeta sphaeroplastigenens]
MADPEGRETWETLLLELVKRYYVPGTAGVSPRGGSAGEDAGVAEGGAEITVTNRSCGDSVTVCLGPAGEVRGIVARGCAVCKASAALAQEAVGALPARDVRELCRRMIGLVTGKAREQGGEGQPEGCLPGGRLPGSCLPEGVARAPRLQEDLELLGLLQHAPGRQRCATLSWEALEKALGEVPRPGESVEPR